MVRRSARKLSSKDSPTNCDGNDGSTQATIKKEKLGHEIKGRSAQANSIKRIKLEARPVVGKAPEKISNLEEVAFTSSPDGHLEIEEDELDLERTLLGGQSFRWIKQDLTTDEGRLSVFTGTVGDNVLQLWRCDSKKVAYKSLCNGPSNNLKALLTDYFQLQYNLGDLYRHWSERDENFKQCSKFYRGFRILRQKPVENLFSFICATNNNIKRISLMVGGMCRRFGSRLDPKKSISLSNPMIEDRFYSFPTVDRLAQEDVFQALRYELGFGYRAKFICETAKVLKSISESQSFNTPEDYLSSLRQAPYKEVCQSLQKFPGIGRKVADCICLMSMDHLDSVPIDCHIYEVVCRNYMKTLRQERKTLTEKVHDIIRDYFVDLHGPLAGWATSVLFVGELSHLKREKDSSPSKAGKKSKQKAKSFE